MERNADLHYDERIISNGHHKVTVLKGGDGRYMDIVYYFEKAGIVDLAKKYYP